MTIRPISLVWVAAESLLLERGPPAGPRGFAHLGLDQDDHSRFRRAR